MSHIEEVYTFDKLSSFHILSWLGKKLLLLAYFKYGKNTQKPKIAKLIICSDFFQNDVIVTGNDHKWYDI